MANLESPKCTSISLQQVAGNSVVHVYTLTVHKPGENSAVSTAAQSSQGLLELRTGSALVKASWFT